MQIGFSSQSVEVTPSIDISSNNEEAISNYFLAFKMPDIYGEVKIEYYTKAINAGGYKRMYVEALKNIKVLNEKNTL